MLKKIIIILTIILTVGCEELSNTPINTIQDFFKKYQNLDKNVLSELNNIGIEKKKLSEEQLNMYLNLFEKQYQNLSYKIKNEEIDNTSAIIITEIEVLDYKNIINNSKEYYKNNQNEITKKYGNYINYELNELKNTKGKIKYEIIFKLIKKNNSWRILELSNDDILKIHGLF